MRTANETNMYLSEFLIFLTCMKRIADNLIPRSVASTLCQELAESIIKVGPGMAIPCMFLPL